MVIFNLSEMEAVVCLKCGTENDFSVRKTAKHNNAYCNGCGKYIKHLPQSASTSLHCPKCKTDRKYVVKTRMKCELAYCDVCRCFIKQLNKKKAWMPPIWENPNDGTKMPFGRFKGEYIFDIKDVGYLKWALETLDNLSDRIRDDIEMRIEELFYMRNNDML